MLRINVFSPLTSRNKCVTDQHRHEHRTETPPTGIPHGEHLLTSATHSALHCFVKNKIYPPGYLIWSSPCRVILPPRHSGGECGHISGSFSPTSDLHLLIHPSLRFPRQAAAPPHEMDELLQRLAEVGIRQQQIVEHLATRQGEADREMAALRTAARQRVPLPDPRFRPPSCCQR